MIVHLFTSNFKGKNVQSPLTQTCIRALIIALVVLGIWEGFWRLRGFSPTIEDDQKLWSLVRSRVTEDTKAVFIGASRIQLGIHPDIFEEMTGYPPLVLAVDGNPPFSVLSHLAADPSFKGTLFCSVPPVFMATKPPERDRAEKWARKYRPQTFFSRLEVHLSLLIQRTFVFRFPGLSLPRLKERWADREWPRPPFSVMRADRYRAALFTDENAPRILASRIRRDRQISREFEPLSPEAFKRRIVSINADVEKIQARGGRVVFIRMPSSGEIRAIESKTWPREIYWDVFAANSSAMTIHFEDHASLASIDCCPDGSHMDVKDAKVFTRKLMDILIDAKNISF